MADKTIRPRNGRARAESVMVNRDDHLSELADAIADDETKIGSRAPGSVSAGRRNSNNQGTND